MKIFFQAFFFTLAIPFIFIGAVWFFIAEAFRVGKEVGDNLVDYLGGDK